MKQLATIAALIVVLGLTACGGGGSKSASTNNNGSGAPSAPSNPTPPAPTPPTPGTPNTPSTPSDTSGAPAISIVDYTKLLVPDVDAHTLHILSPNTLELVRITQKTAGAAPSAWDYVNGNIPDGSKFSVTVNGAAVNVTSVGFKRRALSAPHYPRDLRLTNSLVLTLASDVPEGASVAVKNSDGSVFASSFDFSGPAHPLRYSPAVHVNQEGYVPSWPKKAAVGYYLGTAGELSVPNLTFKIVNAATGASVYSGSLTARADTGWPTSPAPYQKVYEADFTAFSTPGEYKLVVPGLGASLAFMIDEGLAMNLARTYATGLYAQRCGHANELPFTRHVHAACHTAAASVPLPASAFAFTWNTIATYANTTNSNNPAQTAPRLTSDSAQLFPFNRTGTVDVSGGHHDAGDYSKYTTNSALLTHLLAFAGDSFNGVSELDNLGLPESGDGISDVLQEAKIEADFLLKIQDTDGGFYFIVYPRENEYESNVLPDAGSAQVVW
ncbi:MAG TPA: cellulase N-terminal Ig-like domain-containing protein, partial [Acidobacteriota bacterium]|nr:cellulase N-terminal Ig-like domain-containing protein [Acidobacteriota bacterium]